MTSFSNAASLLAQKIRYLAVLNFSSSQAHAFMIAFRDGTLKFRHGEVHLPETQLYTTPIRGLTTSPDLGETIVILHRAMVKAALPLMHEIS